MGHEPTIDELAAALTEMLDENDALRAENDRLRGRLDALMSAFDEAGTLGVLQCMAHDTSLDANLRIRAASAAVPFERPKLALTATTTVPLFDLLEAKRRKAKVIEHDPGPPPAA